MPARGVRNLAKGLAIWCAFAAVAQLGACRCGEPECNFYFAWLGLGETHASNASPDHHEGEEAPQCPGDKTGFGHRHGEVEFLSQPPSEVPPPCSPLGYLAIRSGDSAPNPFVVDFRAAWRERQNPISRLPLRAELSLL